MAGTLVSLRSFLTSGPILSQPYLTWPPALHLTLPTRNDVTQCYIIGKMGCNIQTQRPAWLLVVSFELNKVFSSNRCDFEFSFFFHSAISKWNGDLECLFNWCTCKESFVRVYATMKIYIVAKDCIRLILLAFMWSSWLFEWNFFFWTRQRNTVAEKPWHPPLPYATAHLLELEKMALCKILYNLKEIQIVDSFSMIWKFSLDSLRCCVSDFITDSPFTSTQDILINYYRQFIPNIAIILPNFSPKMWELSNYFELCLSVKNVLVLLRLPGAVCCASVKTVTSLNSRGFFLFVCFCFLLFFFAFIFFIKLGVLWTFLDPNWTKLQPFLQRGQTPRSAFLRTISDHRNDASHKLNDQKYGETAENAIWLWRKTFCVVVVDLVWNHVVLESIP